MTSFTLKVEFEGDVRRFRDWTLDAELPVETQFLSMLEAVRSLFQFGEVNVLLKYKDPEGDLCTLTEHTFHDLLATSREQQASTLKLVASRGTKALPPAVVTESAVVSTPCSTGSGDGPELVDISTPPPSDDEWTIEGELSSEERNRPFFDLVRASAREACERGNGDDGAFQRWVRDFHSERSDVWFSKNYTRLCNAFRPIWDEVAPPSPSSPNDGSLDAASPEAPMPEFKPPTRTQDGPQAPMPESTPTTSSPEASGRSQLRPAFEQLSTDVIEPARQELSRLASSIQATPAAASPVAPPVVDPPPSSHPLTLQEGEEAFEVTNNTPESPHPAAVCAQAVDTDADVASQFSAGHRVGSAASAAVFAVGGKVASGVARVASAVIGNQSDSMRDSSAVDAFLVSEEPPETAVPEAALVAPEGCDSNMVQEASATLPEAIAPSAAQLNGEQGGDVAVEPIPTSASVPVALGPRECHIAMDSSAELSEAPPASPGSGAPVAHAVPIVRGTRVIFQFLQKAAGLNGQEGICQDFVADTGRWNVRLQTGEMKAFKPANLFVLPAQEAQGFPHESSDTAQPPNSSASSHPNQSWNWSWNQSWNHSSDTAQPVLESVGRGLRTMESTVQQHLETVDHHATQLGTSVQQRLSQTRDTVEHHAGQLGTAVQQRIDELHTAFVPQGQSSAQEQPEASPSVSTSVEASTRADLDLDEARQRFVAAVVARAGDAQADNATENQVDAPEETPLVEDDGFVLKASQLADMMESYDYAAGRELLLKHRGDMTAAIAELWPESA